jgi:hypothetical protein
MKKIFLVFAFVSISAFAQQKEGKVTYKYKQYEKFDFEALSVGGELGSPGDLTIAPRYQRKFENPLPYRYNFNNEIKASIERIR